MLSTDISSFTPALPTQATFLSLNLHRASGHTQAQCKAAHSGLGQAQTILTARRARNASRSIAAVLKLLIEPSEICSFVVSDTAPRALLPLVFGR